MRSWSDRVHRNRNDGDRLAVGSKEFDFVSGRRLSGSWMTLDDRSDVACPQSLLRQVSKKDNSLIQAATLWLDLDDLAPRSRIIRFRNHGSVNFLLREMHASFPSAHIGQPVITRITLDFACTMSFSTRPASVLPTI
jgi:hypothetical protein